jgi:rubrerythrin
MTNEEIVSELKSLIQLDIDAIRAYDQAMGNIEPSDVKARLTEFRRDHERHISALSPEVGRFGGTPPPNRPDVKGFVIQGFTAIRSMTGAEGALKAMQSNEKLTNRTYGKAVAMAFPPDLMTLLRSCADDERRHLEYIEQTLRLRPWEATGAHP